MSGDAAARISLMREKWIAAPRGMRRKRERAFKATVAHELHLELEARKKPSAEAPAPTVDPDNDRRPWYVKDAER